MKNGFTSDRNADTFFVVLAESEAPDCKNMGPKLKRAEPDPLVAAQKPQGIDLLILLSGFTNGGKCDSFVPEKTAGVRKAVTACSSHYDKLEGQQVFMDSYPVLIDRVSIRFTNRRRVDLHVSGAQSESRFISASSRKPCADARTERVADESQAKGSKQRNGFDRLPDIAEKVSDSACTLRSLHQRRKKNIFRSTERISDISRVSEGNSIQHSNAHMISNLIEFPSIILT
jgi:hypothetical protein